MQTVLKSLEAILLEGNRKYFTNNHLPLSSGFSQVILEIMELVVILTESYPKVHLVIRSDFSLLLHLLKIMGQFKKIVVAGANYCDIVFLSLVFHLCLLLKRISSKCCIKKYKVIDVSVSMR